MQREIRWLLEEKYGGKRTKEAEKDIARLEKGEHVDYVIGWVKFLGCKIDLSQKPFIPRPETEHWAEKAIQEMLDKAVVDNRPSRAPAARGLCALSGLPSLRSGPGQTASEGLSSTALSRSAARVLDIFAGSGCVGIAVLKHVPSARVDFAEKEKRFLRQIVINVKLNGIAQGRYCIIHSDVFSGVRETYNYILANPPYAAESRRKNVQKSVLENEPLGAVFGGKSGLKFIKKFLREAQSHLTKDGTVYMEFDSPQKKEIERLLKKYDYKDFEFFKDQYGKWRYLKAKGLIG